MGGRYDWEAELERLEAETARAMHRVILAVLVLAFLGVMAWGMWVAGG